MVRIISLFFLLFLSVSIFAQTLEGENMESLKQVFIQHTEAWRMAYNSKDAKNLVHFYSKEASYISSHVDGLEANGREALIANFQRGMSMGGHIDSIEILNMNVSCDQATLLTKYRANNSGQIAVGRNLLVLRKIKDEWVIVLHMTVV